MAKARKEHPKPRSRRSIRRLAEMVEMNNKKIVILEIQDIYKYMDAELIEELKISLTEYL
jgi:predicted protein tyrosine phosphatase